MTGIIARVETSIRRIPLTRPWGAGVRDLGVVPVTITTDDGRVGHGFSWSPTIGASAVQALIDTDLAPWLVGRPASPQLWQAAWEHIHEAGGGGVTTIALAGVDLALWDLACAGRSLAETIGRHHDSQPVYGSGVNLHYTLDELVAQAVRWRDAGYRGVKIKVGKPDLAEDLDRVAAVRETIGPLPLMVDANQRWSLTDALRAAEALAPFGLEWLEEPLRSDDTRGYRALRAAVAVPIALGENVHTIHRFRDLIDAKAIDVLQPNIVRVGGITPFLSIAELAREHGLRLAPHLLPELSAQVAFALPETTWVEDVEDATFTSLGALQQPSDITIASGSATGGHSAGLGMRFR
jgi:L-alanine-DL-glutamate epimerase-like enolase superfamily enzyme